MARLTLLLSVLTALVALLGGFRYVVDTLREYRWRKRTTGKWLAAIMLCATPLLDTATALAANAITPGAVTLASTINAISVTAPFTQDDNANATMAIQFRRTGDTAWLDAYVPYVDRRSTIDAIANPYVNQGRGSIVGLTANTSYDVRVTWTDTDGVTGGQPADVALSTKPSTPTTGGTSYYVNSTTGDDGTGDGSIGNPWATITTAITNTVAGDTINCNGTFAALTISSAGSAGAYRKLQAQSGASCTLSGGTNTLTVSASYWWVHGLIIPTATSSGILVSASNVYLTSNTVQDHSTAAVGDTGGIALSGTINNIFILNNSVTRTTATGASDTATIRFVNSNARHTVVIDGNTLTGSGWDGIGNGGNSRVDNFENMDWSNNIITEYLDDGVELDGAGVNVRLWGNIIRTTKTAGSFSGNGAVPLSDAGVPVGPAYVFRNHLSSGPNAGVGIKGGARSLGRVYILHNTIVIEHDGGGYQALTQQGGTPNSNEHWFFNNIFRTTNNNVYTHEATSRAGTPSLNRYDYDLVFCGACAVIVDNWNDTTNYATWADFKTGTCGDAAGCQEVHSINSDPLITNVNNTFMITSSSPAYNAGVSLANFNDTTASTPAQGAGPDIGAFEVTESSPSAPILFIQLADAMLFPLGIAWHFRRALIDLSVATYAACVSGCVVALSVASRLLYVGKAVTGHAILVCLPKEKRSL